jgi:xylulokinase
MKYILAHDLGTSGNKATLYSDEGVRVASRTEGYPTDFRDGSRAEQNPEDWWRAVCDSTRALLAAARVDAADIAVVALSGQMMGCTPVDARGRALRPSILYCDQRATREADELLERIDPAEFYRICGHRASASYTLEKMMWLRRHEPDLFRQMRKSLCAKDYINARLTGVVATDYSDASGTNAFDLNTFTWSEKILELAEIDIALMPDAVESAAIIGEVTQSAARATGLRAGTPVAAGGGDGSAAGVGVGCVRPGSAYNCLGSSSWIALTVSEPVVDPQMRTMNWAHCVPGYLHPSGTMQTAGSSFRWLAEQLCDAERREAAARGVSVYALIDALAAGVPPGANGVLFMPYMQGERTPWWNPDARGAFLGLQLASTRADMMRAVMEGVALNLALIADIFRAHVPIDTLTLAGGGAGSPVMRQMLADACACRVRPLVCADEATSTGAAIIGGVACGLFKSFDIAGQLALADGCIEPDAANVQLYRRQRERLERSYRALYREENL